MPTYETYTENNSSNKIQNSKVIDIKRGVRQGCVQSLRLLNIYTEMIFKQKPGLNIKGNIVNNLRYADDTVLLAENPAELRKTN
jgi:hypothetical protein